MPNTLSLDEVWTRLNMCGPLWVQETLPSGTVVAMRRSNLGRRRLVIYRRGLTPLNEWDAELLSLVRAWGITRQAWHAEHTYTTSGGQQAMYEEKEVG